MSGDPDIPSRPAHTSRPDIVLPDGRILTTRERLAGELRVNPRTLARGNHATVYVAGVAYLDRDGALRDIAGNLRRRQQPPKPRRAAINKRQLERV